MSPNKRYVFTGLMGCTGKAVVNTSSGMTTIAIEDMPDFLVANFEGFRAEWGKFILEPTPRVHKVFERADTNDDTATMQLLINGKRSDEDTVDEDLKAFLSYYISNAQICFNHVCNASGCTQVATKSCSKCKVAKYCSRDCQVKDLRTSHKNSCVELMGWKPDRDATSTQN